jgi:hypothetical protein
VRELMEQVPEEVFDREVVPVDPLLAALITVFA